MKKSRRVLSIVLSVVLAFASMPMAYTSTVASGAVAYSTETGTIDNPTRPVKAEGVIEETDVYKMNFNSQNTSYTFYQTIDDEYFTFGQTQGVQHYNGDYSASSRTLTFESIEFYTGESGMGGSTTAIEVATGSGRWELPLITTNLTSEYLSKYHVSSTWSPSNSNAQGVGSVPFVLQGASTDISGCRVYTFNNDIIFHGHSANESGEINTGYYEQLIWNWVSDESSANFDLRIGTTLRVLDARELAKEMAEAEAILANPENYTEEYISSVEATLNTIPDGLRDFSEVYSQSEIDTYTKLLQDVSLNSADYTEFNETYTALKSITNANGAYTADSFEAFRTEINTINANLPKNLDKTKQATVDAATQALKDAYELLVVKGTQGDSTYSETKEDVTFTVGNNFKFVQVKDDQLFSYTQPWTIVRGDKDSRRMFYSVLDTSDANTGAFASKLSSSSATTVASLSANAIENTLSNQTILTCWAEVDANGNVQSSSAINSDGSINGSYDGFAKNSTYYLQNSPVFTGMSSSVTGEQTYTYVQKIYLNWQQNYVVYTKNNYSNTSFTTTITITDARQLVAVVNSAKEILANPGTHSEGYLSALQAAVDSVPANLINGVEYYTQAEVDKLYNDITTIPEDVADYSEFVKVFHEMLAENKNKYTEDSYNTFIDEIYSINQNLDKDLTVDNQATVDAAVDALYAAHDKLVSRHLNDDNTFTHEDISDTGNSPLEFSVSSNQYNFMQIIDGQQFAIKTELTARSNKARYTCNLLSLGFSTVSADTVATICEGRASPDDGCHNGENVTINQTETVVGAVTGLTVYDAVNDAGDIAQHNTWVNTEGVPLSTNGVLNDPTELASTDSSAYAEMYYVGATGNHESNSAYVDVSYALRLGWSYNETVLGVEGDSVRRHVHIPVNIKITDARALNTLYGEVDTIMSGASEKNYTYDSLVNLYNVYKETPEDMANGDVYYTQEQVNTEYAELKAAYDALVEGADYSEYFEAYVKAEEIMGTGNADSRGNALYDEATYTKFVDVVTTVDSELAKDLSATDENQATIDAATARINEALAALESGKRADYSGLNDAMTKAEKILAEEAANPGTYTQETLAVIQQAYNNAVNLDKTLPASEQATVDAITSALEAAIEDMEYKADYSEYEEAKSQADSITNTDGTYTDSAYQEYLDKVAEIDNALNKDLPDTAENRVVIEEATQALKDAMAELENNKKADYSSFDEQVGRLEEIVNNPDKYTSDSVEAAKDALEKAEQYDDLTTDNQSTVDTITEELKAVADAAQLKADYTGYNEAKNNADSIVNDDGNGNPIYDETAFNTFKDTVANIDSGLNKDLPDSQQETVNTATNAINNAIATLENNKLADYTDFNTAKDTLQDIVNNPDDYTSESVEAAQKALDAANQIPDGMVVGENNANQEIINTATENMQNVIDSIQKKADYTDYDEAYKGIEEILNNPDKYTDETVEAAQQAKDAADAVGTNQPESNQSVVDEVANAMQTVVNSRVEKADYTEYNNEKSAADALVNDDGNGNPIYDETAFNAYKEAVESIDTSLDKNLPSTSQSTVDEATAALQQAKELLEQNGRLYTITFTDADGATLGSAQFPAGTTFGTVSNAATLPEDTDTVAFIGWLNGDALMADDTVMNGDITVTVAYELKKLIPETDSTLSLNDETGYATGINKNTTVAELKAQLQNDETVVEIKHYTGTELANEDLVGSGSTITLKSKYTGVVYETKIVIIYGDVDGDGDVDNDDYAKVCEASVSDPTEAYTIDGEYREYFFLANDVITDGYIDVLDTSLVSLIKSGKKTVI